MTTGRDFILQVIEMYKERPCLWQVTNVCYHDKVKRNLALEEIVTLYKIKDPTANKETVQKKLNSIRSCFKKELNKVKRSLKSGAHEVHVPKLWYYDQMLFLENQEMPRRNQSILEELPFEFDNEMVKLESSELSPARSSSSHSSTQQNYKRSRSTPDQVLESFTQKIEHAPNNTLQTFERPQLPHQHFGDYVAEKLRNMSPEMVPFCQKIINDAIFNAELGILNVTSKIDTENLSIHKRKK